ncbi:MAG TPA: NAD-dependent epimerase/dehydratase family protein [Acidimicrobiales bacterium]|nr:NAD-dependent epimerase/dehydratase family protein [Acidimicrobiales bacterium]
MQSPRKIAVAGATGRVGHHVVDVLNERGHDVVPMSRSQGVDVITGNGLAPALAGVESVIDAATGPSPEQQAATAFFTGPGAVLAGPTFEEWLNSTSRTGSN